MPEEKAYQIALGNVDIHSHKCIAFFDPATFKVSHLYIFGFIDIACELNALIFRFIHIAWELNALIFGFIHIAWELNALIFGFIDAA